MFKKRCIYFEVTFKAKKIKQIHFFLIKIFKFKFNQNSNKFFFTVD